MNTKEIIKIQNLNKTFKVKQNTITALDNINLDIYEGEIFGIIGLSGAGKSTLVRCINYLERPTAGTVIFDGKDLDKLSPKELLHERRSMGMIFQQFNLLMQRTAIQNICFPMEIAGVPKADAVKRAKELLEVVGLSERENSYPAQLSGGQKQRIAIARALAIQPKVLLCDEATSALDPTTTQSILSLIRDINRNLGITIIVITHEMAVIEQIAQRVAIIDKSHIAEIGNVDDIFLNPKSDIARKLIFPNGLPNVEFDAKRCVRCIRIVFDGKSSYEPVIANLIIECDAPVNILYADTKNIDGKAVGQMLIQLPDNEQQQKRILAYMAVKKLSFSEEMINVE